MTDGLTGTDYMASVSDLRPQEIQKLYRDLQRKNVALEKIMSIVGEQSPAGRVAREALAGK